jgi:hypothetical protein
LVLGFLMFLNRIKERSLERHPSISNHKKGGKGNEKRFVAVYQLGCLNRT